MEDDRPDPTAGPHYRVPALDEDASQDPAALIRLPSRQQVKRGVLVAVLAAHTLVLTTCVPLLLTVSPTPLTGWRFVLRFVAGWLMLVAAPLGGMWALSLAHARHPRALRRALSVCGGLGGLGTLLLLDSLAGGFIAAVTVLTLATLWWARASMARPPQP